VELVEAYRILEVAPGSPKEVTREARNLLAKVWHPDRHATDPKLHDRAAAKLLQINEAYAAIEAAGFPTEIPPGRPSFTTYPPQREAPPARDTVKPKPRAESQTRSTADVARTHKNKAAARPGSRGRAGYLAGAVIAAGLIAFFWWKQHDQATPAIAPPGPTREPAIQPPAPHAVGDGFTIGSTRDEVRKVMGAPTAIDHTFGERWSYGMAEIEFRDGKVFAWRSSAFDKLKVRLAPTDVRVAEAARARGTYGQHASRDEVLGVEGPPDAIDYTFGETWDYGMSNLKFVDGHIDSFWNTHFRPLRITP
jgi:hypothetical protein